MTCFITNVRMKENIINQEYYHQIPSLCHFESLSFKQPITFFVGENGSGKSTLLEAIAINYGFNPEGGSRDYYFSTKTTHSLLYQDIIVSKSVKKATDGFFLRAESFYNTATYLEGLERMSYDEYGGKSLHNQSHGESFINLINGRFRGNGLYILDEPEAALSPQRQLSLLVAMNELIHQQSQLIIATHSPILLSMPNSEIYEFSQDGIQKIEYEESSAYQITKMMMNDKDKMLKHLFE